jgi:hypothetical protein
MSKYCFMLLLLMMFCVEDSLGLCSCINNLCDSGCALPMINHKCLNDKFCQLNCAKSDIDSTMALVSCDNNSVYDLIFDEQVCPSFDLNFGEIYNSSYYGYIASEAIKIYPAQ